MNRNDLHMDDSLSLSLSACSSSLSSSSTCSLDEPRIFSDMTDTERERERKEERKKERERELSIFSRSVLLKDPLLRAALLPSLSLSLSHQTHITSSYNLPDSDTERERERESERERERGRNKVCLVCMEELDVNRCWTGCRGEVVADRDAFVTYCVTCVRTDAEIQIREARMSVEGHLQCICRGCSARIGQDEVTKLFPENPELIGRYELFSANAKAASDPLSSWCPYPDCGVQVKLRKKSRRARCGQCHRGFCTLCSRPHNALLSCSLSADYQFQQWKTSTKHGCRRCPSCKLYIEKDAGCNHMTCSRCRHQFCWVCGSEWRVVCSAPPQYCRLQMLLNHRLWGGTPMMRALTKTAAVPLGGVLLGVGVGAGVGAGALALGVGAAVVCVGVGAAVVSSPVLVGCTLWRHVRVTRSGLKWVEYTPPVDARLRIAETLIHGVCVMCPWFSRVDTAARRTFLGVNGRFTESGVFVAYLDSLQVGREHFPAVLYFLPRDLEDEELARILSDSMPRIVWPTTLQELGATHPVVQRVLGDAIETQLNCQTEG